MPVRRPCAPRHSPFISSLKLTLAASASLVLLGACGGGGSDDNGGPSGIGSALGRWAPFACGDTLVGGTDTQSRGYMLYSRGADSTINVTGNEFVYSAPNCSGTRTFYQPESALLTQVRLTLHSVETFGAYTLRRYQSESINPQTGQVFNSYQVTYTTTPAGAICLTATSESLTAQDIIESHESDSSQALNCGSWEALDDGQFKL